MKSYVLVGLLALFTCGSLFCGAQDAAQSSSTNSKSGEKKSGDAKKINRLPSNFGKLGLSDSQRDKIYGIQNSFADQIDSLESQIDAMKQKRDKEIDAVLSADQRKALNDLAETAKDTKAKSKKVDSEKKPDAGKSDSTSGSKESPK